MPETPTTIKKPSAFTITFDENKSEKSPDSLQEAFLRFKKYKEDGIELARKNRLLSRKMRAHPERMWELRMKFLEQAKKYFGVPYAKKYFSPDSAEYHAPLFLDCCGLVRRVMRDLEQDFGFRIGGGNQAYMFDTLPKTIHDIKDVKPGDLVFISGIYYNPKMRKQRHNMTHVEIMLGEGEKTIGARWNNGKVQIFNSYKFEASSFHTPTYYFKSIDTWLLGICRSFCPKHTWPYKIYKPNRKSIFSINKNAPKKKKKTKKIKSKRKPKHKKLKKKASLTSIASSVPASELQEKQNVEGSKSSLDKALIEEDLDEDAEAECENTGDTPYFQLEDDDAEVNLEDYEEDDYEEDDDFEEDDFEEYDDEDFYYNDDCADELCNDIIDNNENPQQIADVTSNLSALKV